jgi:hypothetical protein
MIEGSFSARTFAFMNVALDRVCQHTPLGEQHDVRERVAQGIIRCAKSGRTTLGAGNARWRVSRRSPKISVSMPCRSQIDRHLLMPSCSTASLEISAG